MVYLIGYRHGSTWFIKIGIAANPIKRLRQLQTGNGHQLSILKAISAVAARRVEQELHRQFGHYRQTGEWFSLDDARLKTLESVMDRLAVGQP